MIRENVFTIRITAEERNLINQIAQREDRTASDAIRRLIRQAAQQYERTPPPSKSALASATNP
jgi:hypothetical protein